MGTNSEDLVGRIRNFRALKDVTITFDNVTTFIGPDGSGKYAPRG